MRNYWNLLARRFLLFCFVLLVCSNFGCMKQIPYQDDQVFEFQQRTDNILLNFKTDKGRQVAFYLPPLSNPGEVPNQIAILYPGIHSLALDWLKYIRLKDNHDTGYLLIDYPGRGLCEGSMRPEENYRNTEGALKALANHFGVDSIQAGISLAGHSFGSGAALQFALRRDVQRVVLVAPFNTMTKAVALQSKFLAFIMPSEIDNVEQISDLLIKKPAPGIIVIHGSRDMTLPVTMARELVAVDPGRITFYEIPDGDHVGILTTHRDLIFQSLLEESK